MWQRLAGLVVAAAVSWIDPAAMLSPRPPVGGPLSLLAELGAHARAVLSPSTAEAAPPRRRRRRPRRSRRARPAPPPKPAPAPAPVDVPRRGPSRIDFDERLIRGQTNTSGAVVLFARKSTGLTSMVDRRRSFRERTIRTIYDR